MHKEGEVYYNGDGKKQKKEEEKKITRVVVVVLPDLPLCVIYEILSWLPVEDILRYRCVCKSWFDLTKDACFAELQWRRSKISQHPSFAVAIDGGRCLFHNTSGNGNWRWGDIEIPYELLDRGLDGGIEGNICVNRNSRWGDIEILDGEISDGIFVASCNGFICISQLRKHFKFYQIPSLVYNPITREKIRLPQFDQFDFDSIFQCGFGFDERSNRYKVILDFYSNHVVAIITVGGDHSWRMVDLPCEIIQFFHKRKQGGYFFNGGFHWLFTSYNLVEGILTLDINTEKFQSTIFSPPLKIDYLQVQLRSIQLGNSLGLFHQSYIYHDRNHKNRSKVIKIWKILGAKPDGSCDYQFKTLNISFDQHIPFAPFGKSDYFQLLAVLSNGDILFKTKGYLILYNQQKDEPSYLVHMGFRVRDKCNYVRVGTFLPTLMSISPHGH